MRQKKQKSEKQLEAYQLQADVISVRTSVVEVHYYRTIVGGEMRESVVKFHLCLVNGIKYIRRSDLQREVCNFIATMERNGRTIERDYIHAREEGKMKAFAFIRTNLLTGTREELMAYLRTCLFPEIAIKVAERMYEAINDHSVKLTDMVFADDEIRKSEEAFARRIKLINEASEERRFDKMIEASEIRLPNPSDDGLSDLVAKIEAMGWEVTLRLKKPGTREDIIYKPGNNQ